MNKSEFLNQKRPLYSTRNNANVIAFRAQFRQQQINVDINKKDSNKICNIAGERVNLISKAYIAIRERVTNALLPEMKSTVRVRNLISTNHTHLSW